MKLNDQQWFNVPQAAALLRLSQKEVREQIAKKILHARSFPRCPHYVIARCELMTFAQVFGIAVPLKGGLR